MTIIGIDGQERQERTVIHTPWDNADFMRVLTPDIFFVSTPSHGGYFVGREAAEAWIPLAARKRPFVRPVSNGYWFEEDVEWASVALSFPELFPSKALTYAASTVLNYNIATREGLVAWLKGRAA